MCIKALWSAIWTADSNLHEYAFFPFLKYSIHLIHQHKLKPSFKDDDLTFTVNTWSPCMEHHNNVRLQSAAYTLHNQQAIHELSVFQRQNPVYNLFYPKNRKSPLVWLIFEMLKTLWPINTQKIEENSSARSPVTQHKLKTQFYTGICILSENMKNGTSIIAHSTCLWYLHS